MGIVNVNAKGNPVIELSVFKKLKKYGLIALIITVLIYSMMWVAVFLEKKGIELVPLLIQLILCHIAFIYCIFEMQKYLNIQKWKILKVLILNGLIFAFFVLPLGRFFLKETMLVMQIKATCKSVIKASGLLDFSMMLDCASNGFIAVFLINLMFWFLPMLVFVLGQHFLGWFARVRIKKQA